MKSTSLAVLAALVACLGVETAAAQTSVVTLPWPPEVLPRVPPLAPETSGVLPLPPRFFRGLSNRERIVVGLDGNGKPTSIRVLQVIELKRLGDYVLSVPAPVLSVTPGPGTESQPGRRENQILWEGFSPGRRVLAAWADLRVAESVAGLPVVVGIEPGEVTIRNATAVTVPSFTADPVPASIAEVDARVRAAVRANVFPEGLNVALRGNQTPQELRVAAPLEVRGTVSVAGERVPFSGRLDGLRRSELRVPIPEGEPKIEMRVRTADIDLPRPASDPGGAARADDPARAHLRTQAPVRPVPREPGPDRAELGDVRVPNRCAAAASGRGVPRDQSEDHTVGWIVLGLLLVATLPVAAVAWARA